jgi:hypothetical protein
VPATIARNVRIVLHARIARNVRIVLHARIARSAPNALCAKIVRPDRRGDAPNATHRAVAMAMAVRPALTMVSESRST